MRSSGRVTRELQDIPPAPRRPRWRPILWHQWPMRLAGLFLAVYGGVITYMMFLAYSGKASDNATLDRDHVTVQTGKITELITVPQGPLRVRYDFRTETDAPHSGECLFRRQVGQPAPNFVEGQVVPVEYARNNPNISRIEGSVLHLLPPLLPIFFWLIFMPGVVLLLLWFVGVLRLRRLLIHGDSAPAEVLAIRHLRYVLPAMMRVDYRYRDRHAAKCVDRHWVRVRCKLGKRILEGSKTVPVIYDRRGRELSRLVLPDDFSSTGEEATPELLSSEEA